MPIHIIRQDITKMRVDAIVNPSNPFLEPTGGTDLAIHKAAGPELLDRCRKLGGCAVGSAKITPAFKLPCKYVIHTAGPDWYRKGDTEALLASCYRSCIETAKQKGCESLAFPLISSGAYGYPKKRVLKIATDTISDCLTDSDMTVYLLVYDKKSYELSEKLFFGIESYIDDNYTERYLSRLADTALPRKRGAYEQADYSRVPSDEFMSAHLAGMPCEPVVFASKCAPTVSLDDFIKLDESFADKLVKLIDAKGLSDVECYKKANVSKQTWHKLMTDKHYRPNKKTAISFAVALELSLEETQKLLASVGFILSDSSLFDVIIKYCLENEIYDVFEIDSALFKYDQETLFSKA